MKYKSKKIKKYQLAGTSGDEIKSPFEYGIQVTPPQTYPVPERTVYDSMFEYTPNFTAINTSYPQQSGSLLDESIYGTPVATQGQSTFDLGTQPINNSQSQQSTQPVTARGYQEYTSYNYTPEINQMSKERYMDFMNQQGYDRTGAGEDWERNRANNQGTNTEKKEQPFPYINPSGSSLSSRAYFAGKGFGAGTPAGTALGITAMGSLAAGLAGDFFSGMGTQKLNQYVREEERRKLRRGLTPRYEAASASAATNNLGGQGFRYGGEMKKYQDGRTVGNESFIYSTPDMKKKHDTLAKHDPSAPKFEDLIPVNLPGKSQLFIPIGTSPEKLGMYNELGNLMRKQQSDPNSLSQEELSRLRGLNSALLSFRMQEGGELPQMSQDPNEQIFTMISQMLGDGQSPESIMQMLVQQGVQPEQAQAMIASVMQQMQQGQEQLFEIGGYMDDLLPPPPPVVSNMQRPDDPMYRRLKAEQDRFLAVRDRGSNIARQVDWPTYQKTDPSARMPMMSKSNLYRDLISQGNLNAFKDDQGDTIYLDRQSKGFYKIDGSGRGVPVSNDSLKRWQQGGEMPQEDPMQQVMQMVMQALQEGAQPEQVVEMLVQQGIPQEEAMQMVQMVMQQAQAMKYGGLFETSNSDSKVGESFYGRGVGDYIEFEYGGKLQKGKIRSIKNGKITLE